MTHLFHQNMPESHRYNTGLRLFIVLLTVFQVMKRTFSSAHHDDLSGISHHKSSFMIHFSLCFQTSCYIQRLKLFCLFWRVKLQSAPFNPSLRKDALVMAGEVTEASTLQQLKKQHLQLQSWGTFISHTMIWNLIHLKCRDSHGSLQGKEGFSLLPVYN